MSVFGSIVERGLGYQHLREYFPSLDWSRHRDAVEVVLGGFQAQDLYPDALPTLGDLRGQGYRTAVIANQRTERKEQLRSLGVEAEVMLMSGEMGVEKPDPAFFRTALRSSARRIRRSWPTSATASTTTSGRLLRPACAPCGCGAGPGASSLARCRRRPTSWSAPWRSSLDGSTRPGSSGPGPPREISGRRDRPAPGAGRPSRSDPRPCPRASAAATLTAGSTATGRTDGRGDRGRAARPPGRHRRR